MQRNISCDTVPLSCLIFVKNKDKKKKFASPVKVLHDDPHEHVEDKEADKEEEGDEVEQPPLVKILLGLYTSKWNNLKISFRQHDSIK